MSKSKVLDKILKDKSFYMNLDDVLEQYSEHLNDMTLKPKSKDKKNYVGIEIECFTNHTSEELTELILENDLEKCVQFTDDGSIEPEFGEATEFRILLPEKNIGSKLKKLSKLFKRGRFGINDSCGLHIHLDMRYRDVDACYNKLLKMQDILFGMVEKERWNNDYCVPASESTKFNRYTAINRTSYNKHKTIEIRLHQATLNMKLIEKWIKLLIKMLGSAAPNKIESKADVLKWAKGKKSIKTYVAKNFDESWFDRKANKVVGMDTDGDDWGYE